MAPLQKAGQDGRSRSSRPPGQSPEAAFEVDLAVVKEPGELHVTTKDALAYGPVQWPVPQLTAEAASADDDSMCFH